MIRIQFYPDSALLQCLNSDATTLGVATSSLVSDILRRHYGLVPESTHSESELNSTVFGEVKDYINTLNAGETFDLLKASITFSQIEMTYAGKPSAAKAKIGKAFAKNIGTGDFSHVRPYKINGKLVKSSNSAAIYEICK
jgi:hypothetical protein